MALLPRRAQQGSVAVQRVHVYYPAEVARVGRVEPVEVAAVVNLVAFEGARALRLHLYRHALLRKVCVGRHVLVDDEVASAAAVVKDWTLNLDAQRMLVVAYDGDLAPLPLLVEADDAEAREPDQRGGRTLFEGHVFSCSEVER